MVDVLGAYYSNPWPEHRIVEVFGSCCAQNFPLRCRCVAPNLDSGLIRMFLFGFLRGDVGILV